MKKTLITSIVVGTIFVGTTTYFCVRNFRTEVQLQNCEKVESERLHQVLRNKELILLTALETDGKIFSPTMADSINNNGLKLALNETPKLIYYYSELNCTSCVEIIIKPRIRIRIENHWVLCEINLFRKDIASKLSTYSIFLHYLFS